MQDIFAEVEKLQKEINTFRPLNEQLIKQIKAYYKIGLTYSSNALEGNSLTETETKIVLEDGITIAGKPLKDHYEAVGHAQAYDFLYTLDQKKDITAGDIKQLHRLFYHRIDEEQAGIYRTERVFLTGSKYILPTPQRVPGLMDEFIGKLPNLKLSRHPAEYAALAHKEFVFIHPFVDGNGRVARLLMNLALLQAGYTIVIIPPVLRQEYIQSLEKAHRDDKDFINLIARMVRETQLDYLRLFKAV